MLVRVHCLLQAIEFFLVLFLLGLMLKPFAPDTGINRPSLVLTVYIQKHHSQITQRSSASEQSQQSSRGSGLNGKILVSISAESRRRRWRSGMLVRFHAFSNQIKLFASVLSFSFSFPSYAYIEDSTIRFASDPDNIRPSLVLLRCSWYIYKSTAPSITQAGLNRCRRSFRGSGLNGKILNPLHTPAWLGFDSAEVAS